MRPSPTTGQRRASPLTPIYTGYLGSFEQIHLVSQFFDRFGGQDTLIYVDPAIGGPTAYFTLALRRSLQGNGQAVRQSRCYCPQPH